MPGPFSKWNLVRNALKATSPTDQPSPRNWPYPGLGSASIIFPKSITDQVSNEIYELVIDCLRDDIPSLLACNLVCRAWAPRSRHHLLSRMVCRPRPLTGIIHGGHGTVNCAVPYPGLEGSVIYGTTDGLYKGTKDGSRQRLLSTNDVSQIEILPDVNLFLCLAGGTLATIPLSTLNSGSCRESDIHFISKHILVFSLFRSTVAGESHRVCALKTSSLSGTIKVWDVTPVPHGTPTLLIARELYIPRETLSIQFLSRMRVVAGLKKGFAVGSGFELVDLVSNATQSLLDPSDPALEFVFKKPAPRPMAVFRVSETFLVCFDKFGFFIDRRGKMAAEHHIMRWNKIDPPHAFAIHEPYILVFYPMRVEVWNVETAEIVQKVPRPHHLLNNPESGEKVLAMSVESGEIAELEFINEQVIE